MNKWWYIPGAPVELSAYTMDRIPAWRKESGGSIKVRFEPNTKIEIPYDIEEIEELYKEIYGLDLPIVYDTIRSLTSWATRSFLVYDTCKAPIRKHVHPPVSDIHGKYVRSRRTITFGVPIKIVEPVKDTLSFYNASIDYDAYCNPNYGEVGYLWHDQVISQATEPSDVIRFPNEDEYLVLDFDSTSTVHWGNHVTDNEYLFVIYEL